MHPRVALCLLIVSSASIALHAAQHSQLWGQHGDLWDPAGRLPDFSFAGYRHGETEPPRPPVRINVRDFGAQGDGRHDDSAAFRRAIETIDTGVIWIPPGRYLLREIIEIRKSGVVLRGAGPGESILYFPIPLQAIRPNWGATTEGRPTSNYSWSGGFIWVQGDYQSRQIAAVTQPAQRGSNTITVDRTDGLDVGRMVELRLTDTDSNSLAIHLYQGQADDTGELRGRIRASITARIEAVHNRQVTLNRPLRFDIQPEWRPALLAFEPTVVEVGIEDLGFAFPDGAYEGHFTELGYNAITFLRVAHSWARNLHIFNAESGIFVNGRFCTIENVILDSRRAPDRARRSVGHHGISFGGDDNLLRNFEFKVPYLHDITVSRSAGNVCAGGRAVDLCFDHHKMAPYANLFTDIHIGEGSRMYQSGGGRALGRHAAAWTTFWNIRANRPQAWPPGSFGPDLMNFVALETTQPQRLEPAGRWFEPIPPEQLEPRDLHAAQLERRLRLAP
jgi:hypothetical protein